MDPKTVVQRKYIAHSDSTPPLVLRLSARDSKPEFGQLSNLATALIILIMQLLRISHLQIPQETSTFSRLLEPNKTWMHCIYGNKQMAIAFYEQQAALTIVGIIVFTLKLNR